MKCMHHVPIGEEDTAVLARVLNGKILSASRATGRQRYMLMVNVCLIKIMSS